MSRIEVTPLTGIGQVHPGDNLAEILHHTLQANGIVMAHGDVLVVAQKVVSKAENRYRILSGVEASPRARELAALTGKDPRLVELVLQESQEIIRAVPGVLIVRHRSGCVMANAGIDASNLTVDKAGDTVLLLPVDADASAASLRADLAHKATADIGVIIADSFGRPWRNGVTNVAIGVAGFPALLDRRHELDLAGRPLQVTQVALGDMVAGAAGLVMGEGAEGIPAAHLRGLPAAYSVGNCRQQPASSLIRPLQQDLFR